MCKPPKNEPILFLFKPEHTPEFAAVAAAADIDAGCKVIEIVLCEHSFVHSQIIEAWIPA